MSFLFLIFKILLYYLGMGLFVSFYIFFAEQASLKDALRQEIANRAWDKVNQIAWLLIQINLTFDLWYVLIGSFSWPFLLILVLLH